MKSTKSVQTISKAYLKTLAQTDSNNATDSGADEDSQSVNSQANRELRQKANKLAMIVSERIDDNSQQIIKGVLVVSRKFSDDGTHVSVTIRVTQSSIITLMIVALCVGGCASLTTHQSGVAVTAEASAADCDAV